MCSLYCQSIGGYHFPKSFKNAFFSFQGGIAANHGAKHVKLNWALGEFDVFKRLIADSRYQKGFESRAQNYYQHKLSQVNLENKSSKKAKVLILDKLMESDEKKARFFEALLLTREVSPLKESQDKERAKVAPSVASTQHESPELPSPSLPLAKVRKSANSPVCNTLSILSSQKRSASGPTIMDLHTNKPGAIKGLKLDVIEVIKAVGRERNQNMEWFSQNDTESQESDSSNCFDNIESRTLPKVRKSRGSSLVSSLSQSGSKKRDFSSPIIMDLHTNKPGSLKGLKLDIVEVIKAVGRERNQIMDWLENEETPKTSLETSPILKADEAQTLSVKNDEARKVQAINLSSEVDVKAPTLPLVSTGPGFSESGKTEDPGDQIPPPVAQSGLQKAPKIGRKKLSHTAAKNAKQAANSASLSNSEPSKPTGPVLIAKRNSSPRRRPNRHLQRPSKRCFKAKKLDFGQFVAEYAKDPTPKKDPAPEPKRKSLKHSRPASNSYWSVYGSQDKLLNVGDAVAEALSRKMVLADITDIKDSKDDLTSGNSALQFLSLLYSLPKAKELVSDAVRDYLPGDFPFFRHIVRKLSDDFLPGDFHFFRRQCNNRLNVRYLPGDFPILRHFMTQQQNESFLPTDFPIFRRMTHILQNVVFFPSSFRFLRQTLNRRNRRSFFPGDFPFFNEQSLGSPLPHHFPQDRQNVNQKQNILYLLDNSRRSSTQLFPSDSHNFRKHSTLTSQNSKPHGTSQILFDYCKPESQLFTFELVFHK